MGQRHQVFILARVLAHGEPVPRYRCIGALHHQWCYGRLPLKAAKRFTSLMKQKDNAEIIREELRLIQGKYGPAETEPLLPEVPCPYTAFLLASAWCVDLDPELHYASGGSFKNSLLDAKMGSTHGDNDDGITVIDITEPTTPSYCFVFLNRRVPRTAEQYVRKYYSVPTGEEAKQDDSKAVEDDIQKTIDALADVPLMTPDVLAEAWPSEYECSQPMSTQDITPETSPAPTAFPSLVDLSIKPAVEYGIQTGETGQLEDLVWLPDKARLIKNILRDQVPFPDFGLSLLMKVIRHEAGSETKKLDLRGFSLSDSQVISISTLPETKYLDSLNLSHNHTITAAVVCRILSTTPTLRRLVLLDTRISDQQIYQLLIENRKLLNAVEELIHPALFSLHEPPRYPNNFAYVAVNEQREAISASLALFTPATVVQSLIDFLYPLSEPTRFSAYSHVGSSLVPQAAFSSATRSEGTPWSERHVHCLPCATDTPFDGAGWLFAAQWSMFGKGDRYGFVSKDGARGWKIYDLRAYLKEMAAEGRPSAPEDAIKKLEAIFTKLGAKKELGSSQEFEIEGAKLWTHDEFLGLTKKFTMFSRFRY
ncbi:hypothetical protein C8R43DRAFT_379092 [Mycena crocata]|nr:hypothetical protein C8R43DRAFT_379092 [Mycena crocata]